MTIVSYQRIFTLSKHAILILPQTFILGGLIQNIPIFFKRFWLYTVPTAIAAGRAGGTTIVITSNVLIMTCLRGA